MRMIAGAILFLAAVQLLPSALRFYEVNPAYAPVDTGRFLWFAAVFIASLGLLLIVSGIIRDVRDQTLSIRR